MSLLVSPFYQSRPVDNRPCHFCRKPIVADHRQYTPLGFSTGQSIHQKCFLDYLDGIQASKARIEKQHQNDRIDIRDPNSLYYQDEIEDPNTPFEEWTDLPGKCYNSHYQRFKDPWEIIPAKKEGNMSKGSISLHVEDRKIGLEFSSDEEDTIPNNGQEFAGRTWTFNSCAAVCFGALLLNLSMNTYYGR